MKLGVLLDRFDPACAIVDSQARAGGMGAGDGDDGGRRIDGGHPRAQSL